MRGIILTVICRISKIQLKKIRTVPVIICGYGVLGTTQRA